MDQLTIARSRGKLIPLMVVAPVFLVLGVLMLVAPGQFAGSLWNSLNLIQVLGWLSLVFFGVALFIGGRRLLDDSPGLVLDPQGFTAHREIVQNIERFAGAKISWQDITTIQKIQLARRPFIELEFKNQGVQTSPTEEIVDTRNISRPFSSPPILLSSQYLSIGIDKLLAHFNKYHQAYHTQSK